MSTANKIIFLSGAFFLLASLILDEDGTEELRVKLGLPLGFGKALVVKDKQETQKTPTVATQNSNISFPSNRALTLDEMYDLAVHVTQTYGLENINESHLVTYAYVESSFQPYVTRNESGGRKSVGLMQTLIGTAQDMYNKGYKAVGEPNEETLKNPIISMYFGAAYIQWLKRNYPRMAYAYGNYEEFFIRAYNGGAGWQQSEVGRNGTANYFKKWKSAQDKVGTRNVFFGV